MTNVAVIYLSATGRFTLSPREPRKRVLRFACVAISLLPAARRGPVIETVMEDGPGVVAAA